MTALADGGWVVVWTSRDQDGSSDGVFLQVFNADGSARGGEVQVNTYVSSSQNEPAIATLADGGWVVTWTSYGQDGSNHGIYQQAFNVDGSPRGGEVQVNTTTDDGQKEPAITALEDGGWVVVWTAYDQDGQYEGIVQQVFNADGTPRGGEVVVNTTYYNEQTEPSVAGLTDGGWVVTWTSIRAPAVARTSSSRRSMPMAARAGPRRWSIPIPTTLRATRSLPRSPMGAGWSAGTRFIRMATAMVSSNRPITPTAAFAAVRNR
ncbi:MAG: hypothetical protein R3D85_10610 [Paracoccaceae bacterium]